jgi:hypothetical protein
MRQDVPAANIQRLERMLVDLIVQNRRSRDPERVNHLAEAITDLRTIIVRAKGTPRFETADPRGSPRKTGRPSALAH